MGGKVKVVCTKAGHELWFYGSARFPGWAVYRPATAAKPEAVIINGSFDTVIARWFVLTG